MKLVTFNSEAVNKVGSNTDCKTIFSPKRNMAFDTSQLSQYVTTANKAGRPKKEITGMTEEMYFKRKTFGCADGAEKLTPLSLLKSRNKINEQQYEAGCSYEHLTCKVRRSMGNMNVNRRSSIDKLQDTHINDIRQKLKTCHMFEEGAAVLSQVKDQISRLHPKAVLIVNKIFRMNNISAAEQIQSLTPPELAIVRKSLDIIHMILEANAPMLELKKKLA